MSVFQSIGAALRRFSDVFSVPLSRTATFGLPVRASAPRLMSVSQVAAAMRITPREVYRLCRGGGLPHFRLAEGIVVRADELQMWRARHP
jgi:hypothetical protein